MLVFLVEEKSMETLLNIILPKVVNGEQYVVIPHEGKSDLKKSIPIKLEHWNIPNTKFFVIQDQDSTDCKSLKSDLVKLCEPFNRDVTVRIACHELEAWYWGDLKAVSEAYGKDFTKLARKSKYRVPDDIENPKYELKQLIPQHQQIEGARKIAEKMDLEHNTSTSFNVFISAVKSKVSTCEA